MEKTYDKATVVTTIIRSFHFLVIYYYFFFAVLILTPKTKKLRCGRQRNERMDEDIRDIGKKLNERKQFA